MNPVFKRIFVPPAVHPPIASLIPQLERNSSEPRISMDLEHVLAKFRVPNVVESRSELDLALSELLVAIAKSNADVPSILNSLACTVHGLLEAALTSRECLVEPLA